MAPSHRGARRAPALAAVGFAILATACSAGRSTSFTRSYAATTAPRAARPNPAPARLVVTPGGVTVAVLGTAPDGWTVRTPCGNTATVRSGRPVRAVDVVIDPGHGGVESGAVGPATTEADLNFDVASAVARDLAAAGVRVALTRTGDYRLPIATRAEIIRRSGARLFVSINHNGGASAARSTPGSEVYYQRASSRSRRLAGLVWQDLVGQIAAFPAHWSGASDAGAIYRTGTDGDYYGILRLTAPTPGVLVEATYLSEPSQAALLATAAFRDAEAKGISRGIQRFLTTKDPGAGFRVPLARPDTDDGGGSLRNCEDPSLG